MPVYLYQTVLPNGEGGETFEVEQSANDAPLTKHPATGEPVRRVFTAPNVALKHTASIEKKLLDPKRTAKAGFSRYERDRSGTYYKISGEGPDTIRAD